MGRLVDTMLDPASTTDYVNTLPGVKATPEEVQQVAAAGIVLLAVGGPEYKYVPEASKILLDVCKGEANTVPKDIFKDPYSWDDDRYKLRGSLSNTILDSASVLATRKNKAAETAGIIATEVQVEEGVFVIGLANGGIISAARTFLQLGEGNHELSFVRYSRHKSQDKEPNMYPYPDSRKDLLRRAADGRKVVIYDEDYSTGETLRTAVDYFAGLFDKEVVGIAPVEVERRITYKPLVIKSE
jgi:hypoxanthine-guanine phosphoribosyltransferase